MLKGMKNIMLVIHVLILALFLFMGSNDSLILNFQDYPIDGFLFFILFLVALFPLEFFFRSYLIDLDELTRSVCSFMLALGSLALIATIGLYIGPMFTLLLYGVVGFGCLWFAKPIKFRLDPVEILVLVCSMGITLAYSWNYLAQGHLIPDADSASVAHLALLHLKGFPEVSGVLPYLKNGETWELSNILIRKPPFTTAIVGFFSKVTRLDMTRVIFWLWVFSPVFLFVSGVSIARHFLGQKVGALFSLSAIFLMHNHQIHLAYIGGEFQEIWTLTFCFLTLVLLKKDLLPLAALSLGFGMNFQPDLAFPMGYALCLFCLISHGPKKFATFLGIFLATLVPFLIQQGWLKVLVPVSSVDFMRTFQILVHPSEFMGQFKFYLILYSLILAACLFVGKKEWKVLTSLVVTFLFFSFYSQTMHWLNPSGTEFQDRMVFPFKIVGIFDDKFLPFSSEYYFYRQGMSWFLILFGILGVGYLLQQVKEAQWRKIFEIAVISLSVSFFGYSFSELIEFPATLPKPLVHHLSKIKKETPISGKVLVPPSLKFASPNHGFHNWWLGSLLHTPTDYGRSEKVNGDQYINRKNLDAPTFADNFWKSFYSKDLSEQKKLLIEATRYYDFLLARQENTKICERIFNFRVWRTVKVSGPYCLFKKP
jgi:hypothetical protein